MTSNNQPENDREKNKQLGEKQSDMQNEKQNENQSEKQNEKQNEKPDLNEVSFQMILYGGNARAEAHEALRAAKAGMFPEADEHLKKSEEELRHGHAVQTRLLQSGEDGALMTANLLFVHAHGHLMTALTEKTLIEELILLYKKLNKDFLHFA